MKTYKVILSEGQMRLYSDFLRQFEYSAVDGVLSPTALEPLQTPAMLQGPCKGKVMGTVEKVVPRLIKKLASKTNEEMEERLYSILLNEEEMKLYSEFLEQRSYTGPTKKQNKELKRAAELDRGYTAIGNNGGVHTEAHAANARRAVRRVDSPKKTYVHGGDNKQALNLRITSGQPTDPKMLASYKRSMPLRAKVSNQIRRKPLRLK